MTSKPLAKVFVLSKDEYDLMEDFLTFYSDLFGAENIVVIDNGSVHPVVLAAYDALRRNGGTVLQDVRDMKSMCHILTDTMMQFRDTAEFLIPLDTDEFMFCLQGSKIDAQVVHDYLSSLPQDVTLVRFGQFFGSVVDPASQDYVDYKHTRPARSITSFHNQGWDKVFFRGCAFSGVAQGNHSGTTTHGRRIVSDALGLLHFHETGSRRAYERCRMSITGYGQFDVDMPVADQLDHCLWWKQSMGGHRVVQYEKFLKRRVLVTSFQDADADHVLPSLEFVNVHESQVATALDAMRFARQATIADRDDSGKLTVDDLVFHERARPTEISVCQVAEHLQRLTGLT